MAVHEAASTSVRLCNVDDLAAHEYCIVVRDASNTSERSVVTANGDT